MNVKLIAIDQTGERREIDDLYFFEEQGIHDLSGDADYDKYSFEIILGDDVYNIVDGVAVKVSK